MVMRMFSTFMRYLVIDFNKAEKESIASDEDVMSISKRIMAQNKEAYEL
jgi:antitoxin Phd